VMTKERWYHRVSLTMFIKLWLYFLKSSQRVCEIVKDCKYSSMKFINTFMINIHILLGVHAGYQSTVIL